MPNQQDRNQQKQQTPKRDDDIRKAPAREDIERPQQGQERRDDQKRREDMERR